MWRKGVGHVAINGEPTIHRNFTLVLAYFPPLITSSAVGQSAEAVLVLVAAMSLKHLDARSNDATFIVINVTHPPPTAPAAAAAAAV